MLYDSLNRLTKSDGVNTTAYVCDAANQLTEVRSGGSTGPLLGGMVYDANGNLSKKCEGGIVTVSSTDCTGGTVTSLTHDPLNRLTQASKTGLATQTYLYDDEGKRIQKSVGGTITNYLYSGPDIVGEYATTWGSPTATLTHGPNMDDPIIRSTLTGTQYYHQDGLGSVVGVSNQAGTTDATARYDAWGNVASSTGSVPQYGYTGREPDETGLVNYRNRYYDPSIGRFIQRDPIGMNGGPNLYAYVGNNPTNLTDPMGLLPITPELVQLAVIIGSDAYFGGSMTDAGQQFGLTSGQQSLAAVPGGSGSGASTVNEPNPKVNEEGLEFIASFESFQPRVYLDPVGFPTIGFGHLVMPGEQFPNPLTREEAWALLRQDVETRVQPFLESVKVSLNQNQVNALGSFVFNVGGGHFMGSTLLKQLNTGNFEAAALQFHRWVYAGGQIQLGLVTRRSAEAELFRGR